MAVRLGYDQALLARVAQSLAQAVMQDMRRSVKERHGLASVAPLHAGVLTAVQRFRSDLGLYVHLRCLVTDGAFEEEADVRFLPATTPTAERMKAVLPNHVASALRPRRRSGAPRRPRAHPLQGPDPRWPLVLVDSEGDDDDDDDDDEPSVTTKRALPRYFDKGDKHWSITLKGASHTTVQDCEVPKTETFASAVEAKEHHEKLVKIRLSRGYKERFAVKRR